MNEKFLCIYIIHEKRYILPYFKNYENYENYENS
jgi:hypothetical protein